MKKILVPTDFSSNAKNALNYALKIAVKAGAEITIFHSFHAPVADPNMPGDMMVDLIADVEKKANKELKKIIGSIEEQKQYSRIKIKSLSTLGFAVEEIPAAAADKNTDLIVMGTKGASGLKELMIGSNTASVVEKSRVPVLAIPEKAKFTGIDKIVYATDFKNHDLEIIRQLVDFARLFHSQIAVLHISSEKEKDTDARLDKLFTEVKYKTDYEKMSFHISNRENVIKGIDEFIDKSEAEMLAMATYKYGLFESLFHKSLTKKMAYHMHIPLLTFHKKTK